MVSFQGEPPQREFLAVLDEHVRSAAERFGFNHYYGGVARGAGGAPIDYLVWDMPVSELIRQYPRFESQYEDLNQISDVTLWIHRDRVTGSMWADFVAEDLEDVCRRFGVDTSEYSSSRSDQDLSFRALVIARTLENLRQALTELGTA
jgi:hypothetical protein